MVNAPRVHSSSRLLLLTLAATLTPLAVLPAAMLGMSSLGVTLGTTLCLVLAVVSLSLGLALALWSNRSLDEPPVDLAPVPTHSGARWLFLLVLTLFGVGFWIFAWSSQASLAAQRPVIDWDGLYYHVPAIHGWARAGRVVWIEGMSDVPYVNGYSMALETLGLWSVQVFGHDRWIDAVNLLWWPVGGLGLAALAQQLGARGLWLVLAATAPALIPMVVIGSATSYVDAGMFCATAVVFALTLWRTNEGTGMAGAVLWGLAMGAMIGVKGTGIPLSLLLMATALVYRWRRPQVSRSRELREWVVAAGVTLLIGGGWPLRALVHTGNPLHPVELRLGGKLIAEGTDPHLATDRSMPDEIRALPAPLRGPRSWLRPFTPITRYDQTEGMGPLWTFAGWPALLALFAIAARRREGALLMLLAASAVWWFLQPAAWWARFSLWLLALGWPAAVALAAHLQRCDRRRAQWSTLAWLAVVLVFSAWVCAVTIGYERDWRLHHAARPVDASDAVGARWPALRDRPAFAQALAAERIARTRVDRLGSILAGALAQPIGWREIVAVEIEPREELATRMRALDLVWLWWDEATSGAVEAVPGFVVADRFDLGGSAVVLLRVTDRDGLTPPGTSP